MDSPFSILSGGLDSTVSPVAQIKEQIDQLIALLAQQEEDLREARIMLNRANTEVMLYGKCPPPDNTANLGALPETASFLVVAMELLDRSQLFRESGGSRFSQREVELVKSAIYNVFETALGPFCIASCCESDLAFANILINLLDEEQPEAVVLEGIDRTLESAVKIVEGNYGIALTLGRSPIVHGYTNLPKARIAAYQVLQQNSSLVHIENTRLVPPPTEESLLQTPQPNTRLEKQYYQFILSRDFDMAKLVLRELTQDDLKSDGISFELAKVRFMNHVQSLLNTTGISSSDIGYLYLRSLSEDEDIYGLMDDLFADVAERIAVSEKAQKEKIEAVAAYIAENYSDCNLCLAKLCDIFKMNQSYLSRTFKAIYQIGILDYIHTQRLSHVKELLKDPKSNIDAIWAAVGYTNRRTFNRAFRKLEGMSASEYRKKLLSQ